MSRTSILGGGRLGLALARRAVARGHAVTLHTREPLLKRPTSWPPGLAWESIEHPQLADVVVIAAPARHEPAKEVLIDRFLAQTMNATVFSAAAYAGAPHERWGQNRAYLRFFCSPAVADATHAALVILEAADLASARLFADWIGPARLHHAAGERFDHLGGILMATVVHLETLRRAIADGPGGEDASGVALQTLNEAATLMSLYGDASAALEACSTPGGLTERLLRELRTSPPQGRLN